MTEQPGCNVEGCQRATHARQLCKLHYDRWRKHGDTGPADRDTAVPQGCSRPGCDNKHYGRGLCTTHYRRWHYRKHKAERTNTEPIENNDACVKCGDEPLGGGYWCRTHFYEYVDAQDRRSPGRRDRGHGTYESRLGHRRRGEPLCPTCFGSITDWLEVMAS